MDHYACVNRYANPILIIIIASAVYVFVLFFLSAAAAAPAATMSLDEEYQQIMNDLTGRGDKRLDAFVNEFSKLW